MTRLVPREILASAVNFHFWGFSPAGQSSLYPPRPHGMMPANTRLIRPYTAIWRGQRARALALTAKATSSQHRPYHSYEHVEPPPFTEAESAILSAALTHVPSHGFTTTALSHGARDAGFLDASINLFPTGVFDLIKYHLVTQRLALKHNVQFPQQKLGVGAKVRLLALQRLRANHSIIQRWQEVSVPAYFSSPSSSSRTLPPPPP